MAQPARGECDAQPTTAICNVCQACCGDFIPDGADCDQCVKEKCGKTAVAVAPTDSNGDFAKAKNFTWESFNCDTNDADADAASDKPPAALLP